MTDSELAKLACMTSDTMLTCQCILLWPNVAQKGQYSSSQKWKLKIIGPIWARKFIFTVLQKNKRNFTFFNDDVQTKMACLSTIMIGLRTCKVSLYDFRYYANMPMYFIVTKCCAKGSIQSSQKWKLKIIGPIWARKFIFMCFAKQ